MRTAICEMPGAEVQAIDEQGRILGYILRKQQEIRLEGSKLSWEIEAVSKQALNMGMKEMPEAQTEMPEYPATVKTNHFQTCKRLTEGTIPSVYFGNGIDCIESCFSDGSYRYIDKSGDISAIEVTSDVYEDAVSELAERIKRQEIEGLDDPSAAAKMIRKGFFTYRQAFEIARSGHIESIQYDQESGQVSTTGNLGISTEITFAVSVWHGMDYYTAVKNAVYVGMAVHGVTFVRLLLGCSQPEKEMILSENAGKGSLENKLGKMLVSAIRNAFENNSTHGTTAGRNCAKADIGIRLPEDFHAEGQSVLAHSDLFHQNMNVSSLTKKEEPRMLKKVRPHVRFRRYNKERMLLELMENMLARATEEYLLSKTEVLNILDELKEDLAFGETKRIFKKNDQAGFLSNLILQHVDTVIKRRRKVKISSACEMREGLEGIFDELYAVLIAA